MDKNYFLKRIKVVNDCWEWQRYLTTAGYGGLRYKTKTYQAHRMSFMVFNNKNPGKLCVLHKCDNTKCVNPGHLFLGTREDNIRDMCNKGRQRGLIGEKNKASKLTRNEVDEIRNKYSDRKTSTSTIGNIYGVSQVLISKILRGEIWK